jgi:hypothetical protein
MAGEVFQLQIDAVNKRLDEADVRAVERFESVRREVAAALNSAERAISKAEQATEKRFESVNEFRETLSDQNRDFVRNAEFGTMHKALVDKVDLLANQIIAVETTVRARLSSATSGPAFLISSMSVMAALALAIIAGAIKMGEIETHVIINTGVIERMEAQERLRLLEHAAENVERGTFQARQTINEQHILKLEDQRDRDNQR